MLTPARLVSEATAAAAQLGFLVDAVFLVGSRAHNVALPNSDYDLKVVMHRRPEDYIDIRRLNPVTSIPINVLDLDPRTTCEINISFIDVTHVASKLQAGKGQHVFDWLQSKRVLYCSDAFIDLINLASSVYLGTPEHSSEMLRRSTQYYWIIGDRALQSALDPDAMPSTDKSRQRLLAALGSACYFHLSSKAESFFQKYPVDLMDAVHAVRDMDSGLITEAALTRISAVVNNWRSENPDNGFLICAVGAIVDHLLAAKFPRHSNLKIQGNVDMFNSKVRSIVLAEPSA